MDKQNAIVELVEILTSLGMHDHLRRLVHAQNREKDKGFRVLFVGEFGRGKSALINALIGQEVLATSLLRLPLVNIIKTGEQKIARVCRNNELHEVNIETLQEVRDSSPIEVFWTGDFPSQGIELIEYPSMSEAPDLQALRDQVENADLIIMTVACDSLYSSVEADMLESVLRPAGHQQFIFVANFLDRLAAKDVEDVKHAALVRLPVNQERIFFVSALKAIDGDPESIASISGIKIKIQEEFDNQATLKNTRLLNLAKIGLNSLYDSISKNEQEFEKTKEINEQSIVQIRKALRALQDNSTQIQLDLNAFKSGTREVLEGKISNFIKDLAIKVENWGADHKERDLLTYLNNKIEEAVTSFSQNDLSQYLETRLEEQSNLVQNGFERYQYQLKTLYNLMQIQLPGTQFAVNNLSLSPSLQQIILENKGAHPEKNPVLGIFQEFFNSPRVLIPLVSIIAGSILLRQYLFIPLGLGTGAYLLTQSRKEKNTQSKMNSYASQIIDNASEIEATVLREINTKITQTNDEITSLLKTTTENAQKAALLKMEELQSISNNVFTAEIRSKLNQIRSILER